MTEKDKDKGREGHGRDRDDSKDHHEDHGRPVPRHGSAAVFAAFTKSR